MRIKQTASLKPLGCLRNVWMWASLSCSRIFKANRPERLQVQSKEPSVCLLPVSALEKVPFLLAQDCAQGSQNLFSQPGQQPKSLRIVRVNWAQADLTALQTLSPQRPRSRGLGAPDCTASWQPTAQPCLPRGPLLSPKTKPGSFPWKKTWLRGRELKRSP